MMDSEWMDEGNCVEQPPGLFFPSDGVGVEVAKKVCTDCPVKEVCLEYALPLMISAWGTHRCATYAHSL